MRSTVFLTVACAIATPAGAQHVAGVSGIHFNVSPSMAGPINGYQSYNLPERSRQPLGVSQAQALIADGQYAQADDLLSDLVGRTDAKQVRFLRGVAKLGLGDAAAARRYFEQSLYYGRNGFPGAMSGLALAEVRLGNRDAAERILVQLRSQQSKCADHCDRAASLDQAITVVEKALT